MIISREIEAYKGELETILANATTDILYRANLDSQFSTLSGTKFEQVVFDSINRVAQGTKFQGSFEMARSYYFPDIYSKVAAEKWFGIEVKTSKNSWSCFGNSVFEANRINHLDDRIYLYFGKFSNPFECKWGIYEDCLETVNITHSPRYHVNMELLEREDKSTVFSKMGVRYQDFQTSDVEFKMNLIRRLKREELGEDVALWWLSNTDYKVPREENNLRIRLFSSLNVEEREEIKNMTLCLFPEIFSNSQTKFNRVLRWFAGNFGVVSGSVRDIFTAGGAYPVMINGRGYRLPKIYSHVENAREFIAQFINTQPYEELAFYWGVSKEDLARTNHNLKLWIDLVHSNNYRNKIPIKNWLTNIFFN